MDPFKIFRIKAHIRHVPSNMVFQIKNVLEKTKETITLKIYWQEWAIEQETTIPADQVKSYKLLG